MTNVLIIHQPEEEPSSWLLLRQGTGRKKKEASWHLEAGGADWLNKEGNKDGGLLCSESVSLHHRLVRTTKGVAAVPFFFSADPLTPHVSPPVVAALLLLPPPHSSASVRAVLQQQVTRPAGAWLSVRWLIKSPPRRLPALPPPPRHPPPRPRPFVSPSSASVPLFHFNKHAEPSRAEPNRAEPSRTEPSLTLKPT